MATGVELATAWVRLVPSVEGIQGTVAKELSNDKGIDAAGQEIGGKFTKGAKSGLKGLAAVVGGAFVVTKVVDFFKDSIDAVGNWQTLNAQTSAVVKSTGGAANVSAEQINSMSQAIEGTTATQAESIQAGANMLLTFKNIRNETGKGNDIFNQATSSLVDMSVAMGTDPKNAAIQLGKALNDPIAGISALSRVGIQFTQDQKDQIKTLVESGKTMDAQKIILGELNSQFGGSGAAKAKTYSGQLFLLQDAFGDMGEAIVSAVVPALSDLFSHLTPVFAWLTDNQGVLIAIAAVLGLTLVGAFIAWTASIWAANAALLANPITWIVLAIVALVAGIVWVATQTTFFQDVWQGAMDIIGGIFTWLWESVLSPIFGFIGAIFTWLYQNIILPIITGIMIYIGLWAALFTWLWSAVVSPVFGFIGAIFQWLYENVILPIVGLIIGYVKMWGAIFAWLYENAIKPAFDGVAAVFNWIWKSVIKPVADFIGDAMHNVGDTIHDVFGGISDFIGTAFKSVLSVVRGPINGLISLVNGIIGGLNSVHVDIPDWVPIVGGQKFGLNIPKIPMLADGGLILQGGSAIVGERGPEVVRLPRGAVVDPDISSASSLPPTVTLVDADGSLLGHMRVVAGRAVSAADRSAEQKTIGRPRNA